MNRCWILNLALVLLFVSGCEKETEIPQNARRTTPPTEIREPTFAEERKTFQTKLTRRDTDGDPVPVPPANVLELVTYESPAGELAAYLSPDPGDGKKHPAIIWISGGFSNSIGSGAWSEFPASNDQSASAYRKAGIIMMYPSLRGGNDNPGVKEAFVGEVDDVIAAAEVLAKRDYVDEHRIYLGGHSTGGTLVLLTAAATDRFRAVFSFGPVADVRGYGPTNLPFNLNDDEEVRMRSPMNWLSSIQTPTYLIEGAIDGNGESLALLERLSTNSQVRTYLVPRANHFDILGPVNKLLAEKVLQDTGTTVNIQLGDTELSRPFNR